MAAFAVALRSSSSSSTCCCCCCCCFLNSDVTGLHSDVAVACSSQAKQARTIKTNRESVCKLCSRLASFALACVLTLPRSESQLKIRDAEPHPSVLETSLDIVLAWYKIGKQFLSRLGDDKNKSTWTQKHKLPIASTDGISFERRLCCIQCARTFSNSLVSKCYCSELSLVSTGGFCWHAM